MADAHLYDLADKLLAVAVAAVDSPPERRYVSNGEVSIDCALVAVELLRVYVGLPGAEQVTANVCKGNPHSADYRLWVTRCVPAEGVPSAAEIDASAREILTDGWRLRRAVITALNIDENIVSSCDNARVGPLLLYGPSGGYGGVNMMVTVQV